MLGSITYDTYKNGNRQDVIIWRNEIYDVITSFGYNCIEQDLEFAFTDEHGNNYEIYIGPKAQACLQLWHEYDERIDVDGFYLVSAVEVMLKCFGVKIYRRSSPLNFGFAIDFLYSTKEAFKESFRIYLEMAIKAKSLMDERILTNNDLLTKTK